MSRTRLPAKFLESTFDIFREVPTVDAVGDLDIKYEPVVLEVPGNFQQKLARISPEESQYWLANQKGGPGEYVKEVRIVYINAWKDNTLIDLKQGDVVVHKHTGKAYTVFGIEAWNSPRDKDRNPRHYKMIVESYTGFPNPAPAVEQIYVKAKVKKA